MLDNIDGAEMVMVDPHEGESVICWFGLSQLHLFDDVLNELEVITIGPGINTYYDARKYAEDWFDRLREEEDGYEDE